MANAITHAGSGFLDEVRSRSSVTHYLSTGLIAGEISGLAMAVCMMAVYLFQGRGILFPLQVIGSFFYGDRALIVPSGGVYLCGFLVHPLGPSLFWGLVYGLCVYYFKVEKTSNLLLLGLCTGIVCQIVDVNLILPALITRLHGHDIWAEQVAPLWSWVSHLVYSLVLACYEPLDKKLSGSNVTSSINPLVP